MVQHRGRVNGMALSCALTFAVAVLAPALRAEAQVRYVRASAPPGGNGLTWISAYNNLQTALAAAIGNPSITQLWIAAGIYKPAGAGGARTATFLLRNNLALYGGFNGTETVLSQRNIVTNVTTLSGDLNADDLTFTGPNLPPWLVDNSYHVVTGSGLGATARLDGVTVRGGGATDASAPNNAGGGLLCVGGSPTIENCTFTRNFANHRGGAADLSASSNASIGLCTFTSNQTFDGLTASDGGGALCLVSSNPTIADCAFASNLTVGMADFGSGGAIKTNLGSPMIQRCTFTHNSANDYGGAIDNRAGSPTIADCTFDTNFCDYGGGVRSNGGQVRIADCTFQDSPGSGPAIGDGVYFVGGTHLVVRCLFDRLTASDGGGALAMGSGAACTLVNCRFVGNEGNLFGAGAVWNLDNSNVAATLTAINCVFSGNRAPFAGGPGGAILTDGPAPTLLANCTFANNTSISGGSAVHAGVGPITLRNCIVVHNSGMAIVGPSNTATYCCFDSVFAGTGNINSSSPGFADENGVDNTLGTPDDDLRLIASSLCIDSARNSDVPADLADLDGDGNVAEPTPLDLALSTRFYDLPSAPNTGSGTPPIVDMGAYEFRPACLGDANGSGGVNVDDLIAVILAWGACANCPPTHCPADVAPFPSGNCAIDVDDLISVILHWGACP